MASERVYVFLVQRRAGKPERLVVWDTQDISVGRAPENDVVVDDPEMSRNHTQFYKSEGGYSVQNMSMSNPTLVNGEPVTSQPLRNKDVVRVAETEYVFCQVTRNPVTLGMKVEYASQLKSFGMPGAGESAPVEQQLPLTSIDRPGNGNWFINLGTFSSRSAAH